LSYLCYDVSKESTELLDKSILLYQVTK